MPGLVTCALLLLIALPSAAAARVLHDGAVSVEFPEAWRKQIDEPRGTGHLLVYEIPFAATDDTPYIAQALLASSQNPNGVPLADWAHQLLRDDLEKPGFAILAVSADSTSCLTIFSTGGDRGARYAVVDRFSSSGDWLARLRIAFPLLKQAPRSWYDRAVPELNAVLASFNRSGRSPNSSQLQLSGGVLGLVPVHQGAVLQRLDHPILKSPLAEGPQGLVVYAEVPVPSPAAQQGAAADRQGPRSDQ